MTISYLQGIPTGQALGLQTIPPPPAFTLSGIVSGQALGTQVVFIGLGGIASSEAFGSLRVDPSLLMSGIASSAAFGDISVARPFELGSIASLEVLGAHSVELELEPSGVGTSEAFGTMTLTTSAALFGIGTGQTLGLQTLLFDQPVSLSGYGITSLEGVSNLWVGANEGHIVGPESSRVGPTSGGHIVTILAPGLDMNNRSDSFSDGVFNGALWSASVTGSGRLVEHAGFPTGTLQLSTGEALGSSAIMRSVDPQERSDASVDLRFSLVDLRNGVSTVSAWLGVYISTSTFFRASVEFSKSAPVLRFTLSANGTQRIDAMPLTRMSSIVRLRVLRSAERVFVYMNDALVYTRTWTTGLGYIEIGSANDATSISAITTLITRFVRNPVILFGTEPMKEILSKTRGRITGRTPPQTQAGEVLVHVDMTGAEYDLEETYEYQNTVDFRDVGQAGSYRLVVTSDSTVRN